MPADRFKRGAGQDEHANDRANEWASVGHEVLRTRRASRVGSRATSARAAGNGRDELVSGRVELHECRKDFVAMRERELTLRRAPYSAARIDAENSAGRLPSAEPLLGTGGLVCLPDNHTGGGG